MPLINIEYNDNEVNEEDILALSNSVRDIVSTITGIEDVFAYANSSHIKIKIAPIEIFIHMSQEKIENEEKLVGEIKSHLLVWKKKTNFPHLINLTLIPMNWKIEIGI